MSSVGPLLSVLAGFGIAYVLLPWLVLPRPRSARNALDAHVINFVRWIAIVFVATHVLVALRLYETLTIWGLCLFGMWRNRLRPRGWTLARTGPYLHGLIVHAVGASDRLEREGTRGVLAGRGAARTPGGSPRPARSLAASLGSAARARLPHLVLAAPLAAVAVGSFLLRVAQPLASFSLAPPDAYVHLTWAKALTVNRIFVDGIYPQGMAAFLAFLGKFSLRTDMADVVRFAGPIVGTLVVAAIGYTALRLTRSPGGALLAAGGFGLFGASPEWREPWERQVGVLPQELALALAVLGLALVVLCVTQADRDHLWSLVAVGLALGLTHPIPMGVFLVLSAIGSAAAALFRKGGFRRATEALLAASGGALLGLSFIPIARLAGVPLYAGAQELNPFSAPPEQAAPVPIVVPPRFNTLTLLAAAACIAGLIGGLALAVRRRTRPQGARLVALSAIGGALLALYDPRWLGLAPFYGGRLSNVVGPQMALALAAGVGSLSALPILRRSLTVRAAAAVVAGGIALAALGANLTPAPRSVMYIDYSASAEVTRRIKAEMERFAFTIVGTPEERQVVLGSGFSVVAVSLKKKVLGRARLLAGRAAPPLAIARDPGATLPIPTPHVFLMVEKQPFPVFELPPRGPTEEFYRNRAKRGRIMAVLYAWAEQYMRTHSDMTVFYDDPQLRVYHIHDIPDVKAADRSPFFKDYRWRPGALFNEGPDSPAEVIP